MRRLGQDQGDGYSRHGLRAATEVDYGGGKHGFAVAEGV